MSNLLPMHYSTVNTCKRKQKKKSVSMTEAEHKHAKFLKKMGVGGRSSVGRAGALQASGQEFDSPRLHHSRSVAQPGSASALGAEGQKFESSHSDQIPMSNDIPVGIASKKELIPHNFTIAPAYNKGPYQVISKNNIKDIGR